MPTPIYNYSNKSDLQNFNRVISVSLDEMKSFIDEISDTLSIDFVKPEHFAIIASLLNVDLNKSEDEYLQRRQLKTALDLIKSKGTIDCFKVLMYNFGLEIEIIPLWTADYVEKVPIYPPTIVFTQPELSGGSYKVTVLNPDGQFADYLDFIVE